MYIKILICGIFFINLFNNFAYSFPLFSIPIENGKIVYDFLGSSERYSEKIYLISDKHCDTLTQKNINFILEIIKKFHKKNFNVVGLEGTPECEIDTSFISSVKNKKYKNSIINFALKNGLFSGAEIFKINHQKNIKLFGVENKNLYLNNFNKFFYALENQDKIITIIHKLLQNYNFLSKNFLSDKILTLENIKQKFLKDNDLENLIDKLKIFDKNLNISIQKFPNIQLLKNLLDEKNKIDKNLLQIETKYFVKKIYNFLDKNEINYLKKYKNTKNFYIYLNKILLKKNINPYNYKNLSSFINYETEINKLNNLEILDEINIFFGVSLENYFKKNDISYDFYKNYLYLNVLKNYLTNHITNEEYIFYKDKIDINEIIEFSRKINISLEKNEIDLLLNTYKVITNFYNEIEYRNKAIINNLLKQKKSKIKALVIGGFHINGIKEYLMANGIPFSIIIPEQKSNKKENLLYKNRLINQNFYIKSKNIYKNLNNHKQIKNIFLNAISLFFQESNKNYLEKNSSYMDDAEIYNFIADSQNFNSYNVSLEKLKNNTIFLLNILVKKSKSKLTFKNEEIDKFLDDILENNFEQIIDYETESEKQQKTFLDFYKFIKLSSIKYIESNNNNETEKNFLESLHQKNPNLIIKKYISSQHKKNGIFFNIYKNIDNLFRDEKNKNEKIDLFLYSEEDILFFNTLNEKEKEEYVSFLNKVIEQNYLLNNHHKNLNTLLKSLNYFPKNNIYKTKKHLNMLQVKKFWENKKNGGFFSKKIVFFKKILNFLKKIIFYAPPDGYDDTMQIIRSFKIPELLANIWATILYILGAIVLGIFSFKSIKSLHENKKKGFMNNLKSLTFWKELSETLALICMTLGMCLAIIGIWHLKILFKMFTHIALLISNILMVISNLINIFYSIKKEYKEKIEDIEKSNISQISKKRYKNFAKIDRNIDYVLSISMIIFQGLMALGILIILFNNPISAILSGIIILIKESLLSSILLMIGGIGTIIVLIFKFGFIEINKKRKEIPFDKNDENNEKTNTSVSNISIINMENGNKKTLNHKIQGLVDKYIFKIAYKNKIFKNKKLSIKYFKNQLKQSGFFPYLYRVIEQDMSMQYMDEYIKISIEKINSDLQKFNNFKNKNIYFTRNQKIANVILLITLLIIINILAIYFSQYIFFGNIIAFIIFFVVIKKILKERKRNYTKEININYKKSFLNFLLDIDSFDKKLYTINLLNSINNLTNNNFSKNIKTKKDFYFLKKYLLSSYKNINFNLIHDNDDDFEKVYEKFINYCFNYLLSEKTNIFFKKQIFILANQNDKEFEKNILNKTFDINIKNKNRFSIKQSNYDLVSNSSDTRSINYSLLSVINNKIHQIFNIQNEKILFNKNIKNIEIITEKNVSDFLIIEKTKNSIILKIDIELFRNLEKLKTLAIFKQNKDDFYEFLASIFYNILRNNLANINDELTQNSILFLDSIKKITRFKFFTFKGEKINDTISNISNILRIEIKDILELYKIKDFYIKEIVFDTKDIKLNEMETFLNIFPKKYNNEYIKIIFSLNNDFEYLKKLIEICKNFVHPNLQFEIILDEKLFKTLKKDEIFKKLLDKKTEKLKNIKFYKWEEYNLDSNFNYINKNLKNVLIKEYVAYNDLNILLQYNENEFSIKNITYEENFDATKEKNIDVFIKDNNRNVFVLIKNSINNILKKNIKDEFFMQKNKDDILKFQYSI